MIQKWRKQYWLASAAIEVVMMCNPINPSFHPILHSFSLLATTTIYYLLLYSAVIDDFLLTIEDASKTRKHLFRAQSTSNLPA
jgi:hypothetical protein